MRSFGLVLRPGRVVAEQLHEPVDGIIEPRRYLGRVGLERGVARGQLLEAGLELRGFSCRWQRRRDHVGGLFQPTDRALQALQRFMNLQ